MAGAGFQTTSSFYSDIQIGAVEIKDANSDVRATVGNETTSAIGLNTLPLGLYLSTAPTLVNNDTFPLTLTSNGRLRVDAAISVEIASEQMQVRSYPAGVSTDIGYRIGTTAVPGPDLSMPSVERFQAIQTTINYVGGTDRVASVVDTDQWGRTLTTTMTYSGNRITAISEVIT